MRCLWCWVLRSGGPCPFLFAWEASANLPWLPEVFLAWGGNFRCWPSVVRRSREKNALFARVTIKTWQKPETALEKSLAPRVPSTFALSPKKEAWSQVISLPACSSHLNRSKLDWEMIHNVSSFCTCKSISKAFGYAWIFKFNFIFVSFYSN